MIKIRAWIVSLFVIAAMLVLPFGNIQAALADTTNQVTLVVVGDSERKVILCPKEIEILPGDTALAVLQREFPDKVLVQQSSWGEYLAGIDGLNAGERDPNSYWSFEVNGSPANVGAGSYEVQQEDTIAFRYVADWNVVDNKTLEQSLEELGGCSTTQVPTTTPDVQEPSEGSELVDTKQVDEAITGAVQFILDKGFESDWEVIGVIQSGYSVSAEAKQAYLQSVEDRVNTSARLNNTTLAKTILAVNALGASASNFAGQNLVAKLYNDTTIQAVNAYAYALLALDSREYDIPNNALWTRENLIANILEQQHTDGGWAFSGNVSEPSDSDMTGMVMTALSPYIEDDDIFAALVKATAFLEETQTENGGYGNPENANSAAQALMGLTTIGIDPMDEQFTKNGQNLVQNLLSYQLPNGGFKWLSTDTENSPFALDQALYALVQYKYFLEDKGSIFQWDKEPVVTDENPSPAHSENLEQPEDSTTQPSAEKPASSSVQQATTAENTVVAQVETTHESKTQTLPDTALFGVVFWSQLASGIILVLAAALVWRKKTA